MEDETSIEIEPERAPETPLEVQVDVAEEQADIAIELATDVSIQLDELRSDIVALTARIQELESSTSNARTDHGNTGRNTEPDQPEATPEEISVIQPKREHPYYRKLW